MGLMDLTLLSIIIFCFVVPIAFAVVVGLAVIKRASRP
jgi:hypothetical protein